jgi:type IV pilus assembly protein PilP
VRQPGRAIAALLAAACAGGCSEQAAPPQVTPPPRVAPPPPGAMAGTGTEVVAYSYDPANRRDPFRSFVRSLNPEPGDDVSSPLERFDLSQLDLSAIIWGIDAPRALIVDPSGKGYIVGTGAVLGKNKGRIISIGDNVVVIKETYVDSLDRATTKPVELRLRETEGG